MVLQHSLIWVATYSGTKSKKDDIELSLKGEKKI